MKTLRTTLGIASLLLLLGAPGASAATLAQPVVHEVTLPTGAQGLNQGYLPTLSCTSATNCTAGGSYINAQGNDESVILSEVNGVWTAPTTLKAPANASPSPGMTIYGLSCAQRGQCVAVGSYQDSSGNTQGFVDSEVNGVWANAHKVALPPNALINGQDASVRNVSCPAINSCSAVGGYLDNTTPISRSVGFALSEVNGTWRRATPVTVTGGNFNPFVTMGEIGCTSSGNCVAVGTFINANDANDALLIDQVNGVWSRSTQLTLPPNASPFAGVNTAEITCVRGASCTIFGTYNTATGAVEALGSSEVHGVWSPASEISLPANAGVNPHVFLYDYQGVACSSSGNCSAGGQYQTQSGRYEGFLVNEVGATWHPASELLLPAGAQSAGKNGGVVALTCPTAGNCRAGAAYLDAAGRYQALVVSEREGTWQRGTSLPLPAGAATVGVDGGVYALDCSSPTSCTGVGSYLAQKSTYEGFTFDI